MIFNRGADAIESQGKNQLPSESGIKGAYPCKHQRLLILVSNNVCIRKNRPDLMAKMMNNALLVIHG
jgi:hypothetical protein